jgi:predicted SprT family Zn-dependent metalloprotease
MTQPAPTVAQTTAYQALFDHFNVRLFGGQLSHVVLNFSRHARAYGFFAPDRWHAPGEKVRTHEISLNPSHLSVRTLRETAGTLVHEMVHAWDQDHGKPGRGGYHGKSWARKMRAAPGGKETGQRVSHYIVEGGPFAEAFSEIEGQISLPFVCSEPGKEERAKAKRKIKYTCGECGVNAWGKPGLRISCEDCDVALDPPADEDGEDEEA